MAHNCHIKTNWSQQIQITHSKLQTHRKFKSLTANYKSLTTNSNHSQQLQITYGKLQIINMLGVFSHLQPAVQDVLEYLSSNRPSNLKTGLTVIIFASFISTVAHNCHIKTKRSQQIQITHSKLQITHNKFRSFTVITNQSQQITNY